MCRAPFSLIVTGYHLVYLDVALPSHRSGRLLYPVESHHLPRLRLNDSFFWSTDFLGSLAYVKSSALRRLAFVGLLLMAGVIAVLAGPATAVLMIPRQLDWPMGGSRIWLNGNCPASVDHTRPFTNYERVRR